jgi:hypothetical protein
MRDTESDTPPGAPSEAQPNAHLGFRIAVGIAGLVLIGLFVLLGIVAMKQSATSQALDAREPVREAARPASAGK